MRRVTSMVSSVLNSAGSLEPLPATKIVTSAVLRAGRSAVPEKITSSIAAARMLLCELSPITQRSASSRLDLPQPLGPTTPVKPDSTRSSVGSTNDLKPNSLSRLICMKWGTLESLCDTSPMVRPRPPRDAQQRRCRRLTGCVGVPGLGHLASQDRIHHLADFFDADHRLHQFALDEKIGRPDDAERSASLLDPVELGDHGAILAAAVKLRARHPHLSGNLKDRVRAHLLAYPGGLLGHELVVEKEILVRRRASERDGG